MSYTIIRAVTNNYDTIFECNDTEADKRLLFTDKPANVKKWEQKIISANKEFPFDDIFNIRWKPFEHTNTDYVIWLDGSLKILGSVKPYIEAFEKSGDDVALLKHPCFALNKFLVLFQNTLQVCQNRNLLVLQKSS